MKIETKYSIGDKMYTVRSSWDKLKLSTHSVVGIEVKKILVETTNKKSQKISQLRTTISYKVGKNLYNSYSYTENSINNPKEYNFISNSKIEAKKMLDKLRLDVKNKKLEAKKLEIEEIKQKAIKYKLL